MSPEVPISAIAADLRALADLTTAHPELDAEITAAAAELHIVLAASDLLTPADLAAYVVAAGGRVVQDGDKVHADPSFDTAEVTLPAGVITLNVHKMRPNGPMLAPPADGPVVFDEPDELTKCRATLAHLADEVDAMFRAPDQQTYSRAFATVVHRLQEVRRS